MTRRELLQHTASMWAIAPALALAACKHMPMTAPPLNDTPQTRVTVDIESDKFRVLEQIGGSVYVVTELPRLSIIVTRIGDLLFDAVSSTCTHAGCDVDLYNPLTKAMRCDCHNSAFGPDGTVLGGPAMMPLRPYPLSFDGGSVLTINIS